MKKISLGLGLLLLVSSAGLRHEFYLSLTEIRFNPVTKRMEVSMRIFPDDLDRALFELSGIHTQLATEMEAPEADSLLAIYLQRSLNLRVDGQDLKLEYLGKESEANAIWCYLESGPLDSAREVFVRSSLLTEIFEEQVNIIQLYIRDWNRGEMLNRDRQEAIFTPPE